MEAVWLCKTIGKFCILYVLMTTVCVVLYIEYDAAVISFNITVGYKDTPSIKKGKWSVLSKGHVSRVMTCTHNDWVSDSITHSNAQ